jgi:hypothetical protein
VYNEWGAYDPVNETFTNAPEWAREKSKYSVFLYQKHNPHASNYISHNLGTEAGVYLRYIVDHYDNFPDVALFVHADPFGHNLVWPDYFNCVSSNVSYFNINSYHENNYVCRNIPGYFFGPTAKKETSALFIEQCARNILKIIWNTPTIHHNHTLSNTSSSSSSHFTDQKVEEFEKIFPKKASIDVCTYCCQQFLLSRNQVRKRPLHQWIHLLKLIGEQNKCHMGELEFDSLHSSVYFPEIQSNTSSVSENQFDNRLRGFSMEHLAHVIYGERELIMPKESNETICHQFLPRSICPNSPCIL